MIDQQRLALAAITIRPAVMDGSTKVLFHRWRDRVRCAVGDGSCLFTETVAIVEMYDGQISECDPHQLRFTDDLIKKLEEGK